MKILIMGGSYFLGLCFTREAYRRGWEISLCNRGSRPLGIAGIREFVADRSDGAALERIPEETYDAVVDFCAYRAGDLAFLLEHLKIRFRRYLLISTVDVLRRGTGRMLREEDPFEERDFGGEAGAYILGKAALERELFREAGERGFSGTVIRPGMIYGPGNYAPREGMYFHWIREAGQILCPSDADGSFQLVYVEDVAQAICLCLEREESAGRVYHVCAPERLTYDGFTELLRRSLPPGSADFTVVPLPVSEVLSRSLPLPFSLTAAESETYDGSAIEALGLRYTPHEEGMRKTWEAWSRA